METITLLDGRILPVEDIRLESDGWNFTRVSSGERLTYKIKQSDKRYSFPGFDVTKSNDEIYRETSGDSSPMRETNTTKILATQLVTDPLAAPAETLSNIAESAKKVFQSPLTWGIVLALVAGLVIWFVPRKP